MSFKKKLIPLAYYLAVKMDLGQYRCVAYWFDDNEPIIVADFIIQNELINYHGLILDWLSFSKEFKTKYTQLLKHLGIQQFVKVTFFIPTMSINQQQASAQLQTISYTNLTNQAQKNSTQTWYLSKTLVQQYQQLAQHANIKHWQFFSSELVRGWKLNQHKQHTLYIEISPIRTHYYYYYQQQLVGNCTIKLGWNHLVQMWVKANSKQGNVSVNFHQLNAMVASWSNINIDQQQLLVPISGQKLAHTSECHIHIWAHLWNKLLTKLFHEQISICQQHWQVGQFDQISLINYQFLLPIYQVIDPNSQINYLAEDYDFSHCLQMIQHIHAQLL